MCPTWGKDTLSEEVKQHVGAGNGTESSEIGAGRRIVGRRVEKRDGGYWFGVLLLPNCGEWCIQEREGDALSSEATLKALLEQRQFSPSIIPLWPSIRRSLIAVHADSYPVPVSDLSEDSR